jgi:predicted amidophosphoribosyltransferase
MPTLQYRSIQAPQGLQTMSPTNWVRWAIEERLIPPVAPSVEGTCLVCHGAIGTRRDGRPFDRCRNCRGYRTSLAGLVPIVYSMAGGLESLLHQYKDWGPECAWMARPLASLLHQFLSAHLPCIEGRYGACDVAAIVPGANSSRPFDHLTKVIDRVDRWPVVWDPGLLRKVGSDRPTRGTVDPRCYKVADGRAVTGTTIILVDDTWTSGSSLVSAASRLMADGAASVIGLTIGRQLRGDYGTTNDVVAAVGARTFDNRTCVLCG